MKSLTTNEPLMIAVASCDLWPDGLQERFKVCHAPDIDERAYRVNNLSNEHEYIVRFGMAGANRLAGCTCADFQFKSHVCKHIKAAAPLHRWRMREQSTDPRFYSSRRMMEQLICELETGKVVSDFSNRVRAILARSTEEGAAFNQILQRQFERRQAAICAAHISTEETKG